MISTNIQVAIEAMLVPVIGSYFWGKRCILTLTPYLYIVDSQMTNLTYQEKLNLVPIISRMNVVHKLIFNII